MHEKAKKRVAEAGEKTDTRPNLLLPKKGNVYNNFKGAVSRLCETVLADKTLTIEQKNKIAALKARVEIEI